MPQQASLEQTILRIQQLTRERCIHELTHFDAIRLDFTRDFLQQQEVDWLRHTLLAAELTAHRPQRCAG